MINIPIEQSTSEIRARVRLTNEFVRDSFRQLWPSRDEAGSSYPYNKVGIRAIGGKLKSSGKFVEQSIRFSTKKFKWTIARAKKWLKAHGYSVKALYKIFTTNGEPIWKGEEYTIFIDSTEAFKVKSLDDDERWIIRGVISSDRIDKHNEIVDPGAVMRSKDEYLEFGTVRYMHQAEPIGNTLKMWREGNKVWAEIEIHDNESKIWHKIEKGYLRAFSIGFRVFAIKNWCPNGEDEECYIKFTEISLIEISVVDSPANTDAIFEVKKQLKEIGGDALVNKMIMKVVTPKEDPTLAEEEEEEYVEWEGDEEGEKMKEEKTEQPAEEEVEEMEEETAEEKTSESEPETQSEEKKSEAEEAGAKVDDKKEEEEELDFIDAEKEEEKDNTEAVKNTGEIESLKSEISGIKESLVEILKAIESMKVEKEEKQKILEKENEELKEKVEEKKLPKRKSYKETNDDYNDDKKEGELVDEARRVGKKQLKRLAATGYF